MGAKMQVERPHRTPDEAARPPRADGRGAGRQHEQGRALLNTTQSAISRSIADLEQTIGVRLLDRNAQGVEPTQYGRALLKRGIAAFDELKQGVRDIEFLSDPGAGELRIGCSPAVAEGIVLAVIEKLSRQYPRVVFHVTHGGALALSEALRTRRIDLGFGEYPAVTSEEDVDHEVLLEVPLVVVAGVDNPWARRRKIALAELVNEPWTWPPGTAVDTRIIEAFRASGLEPPRPTVYAEAINMRTRLAANGRFLAVVPAYIMRFPGKYPSLKVLPVELPDDATTERYRHAQEPHAESAGAALHRLRTRGRKAAGKEPSTDQPGQELPWHAIRGSREVRSGSIRVVPGRMSRQLYPPKPDTHRDACRRDKKKKFI